MFEDIIDQLEELGKIELQVSAVGVYTNRKRTKVQDVAIWQNYGTETISPAKFVAAADDKNSGWDRQIEAAIEAFLFDSNERALNRLGERIARDINTAVNRIDTRRLKHSMRHKIVKK